MRKTKTLLVVALATCLGTLGIQAPAQAATDLGGVSVEAACDHQRGSATSAQLVANNVYGWRCVLHLGGTIGYYSVDINQECRRVHGSNAYAGYLNYNDPYSWRCYR